MKCYAVIILPAFRLQAVCCASVKLSLDGTALVERRRGQWVVCETGARVRAAGVWPGMTSGQAMARLPGIHLTERSAAAEHWADEVLFLAALTLTPMVERSDPGRITALLQSGLGGKAGGVEARCNAVLGLLRTRGLSGYIGVAETPALARWAALLEGVRSAGLAVRVVREREALIREISLRLAGASEGLERVLTGWGLRTLADLVRLPRAEVADRLGAEGRQLWDLAAGAGHDTVLHRAEAPQTFRVQEELEYGLETLEPVLFLLRRQLELITLQLAAGHRVADSLELRLQLADGSEHRKLFRLPSPTREVEPLFRLLDSHLAQVKTTSEVVGVALEAWPTEEWRRQLSLFETQLRNPQQLRDTLTRLSGLLGDEKRVGSPLLEDSHHPDRWLMTGVEEAGEPYGGEARQERAARRPLRPAQGQQTPVLQGVECEKPDVGLALAAMPKLEKQMGSHSAARRRASTLQKSAGAALQGVGPVGLPLRRWRPAVAAQVELEEGVPVRVASARVKGVVSGYRGPWRHSGEWWDEGGWAREEWDVELAGEGLYRLLRLGGGYWWMEGEYS